MQSHPSHLCRSGRFYQFRYVIPEPLRQYVRKREIKRTLRTSDLPTAMGMAERLHERIGRAIGILAWKVRDLRICEMSLDDDIREFAVRLLREALDVSEKERHMMTSLSPELLAKQLELAKSRIAALQTELARNDYATAEHLFSREYRGEDLAPYPPDSDERSQLGRECTKALIAYQKVELQRLQGHYDNPYDQATDELITAATRTPPARTVVPGIPAAGALKPTQVAAPAPVTISLSDAIRSYTEEQVTGGAWTARTTKQEYQVALNLLLDYFGNVDLATFTHQALLDLRNNVLSRLPANREKKKAYRDKSIAALLKDGVADEDRMDVVTVNKYLRRIGGLFNWAVRHSYIPTNPAQALQYKKTKAAYEARAVYTQTDLEAMVTALANLPRRSLPWQYWIPLVALYSGMRQNEIGQLRWKDVVEKDGIRCFDINDHGEKTVKTASSVRLVPVHPALLSLGFLDYVKQAEAEEGNELLWPGLPERRDSYGQSISRWFAKWKVRWLPDCDEQKDFHSFRHTFANALKQTGVLDVPLMELMGHSLEKSQTFGRYGKPLNVQTRFETISKLDYKLDLDSIRRNWAP